MNIKEFRSQYPHYDDLSDTDLASALHRAHYSDIPKHEFDKQFIGTPMHDDLETASVRAADSLELQKIDPTIKPVIVGTRNEVLALKKAGKIPRGSILFLAVPDKAYVIDPKGVKAIYGGDELGAVKRAKLDIIKGNDSHLLGYPDRTQGNETVAVTKQGEILTELSRISDETKRGNVAYGAAGSPQDALQKAAQVSQAIRLKTPRKWKEISNESDDESREGQTNSSTAEEDQSTGSNGQGQEVGLRPSVLYKGQQFTDGTHHDDILDNSGLDRDDGVRGFQTPEGKFLSRSGGMNWIKENQPDIHQRLKNEGVDELHSQDINRVYA